MNVRLYSYVEEGRQFKFLSKKLSFIDLTDLMPTDRLLWEYAHL